MALNWGQLRNHLLPGDAERDEGFHQEILRLSHAGLKAIAWMTIVAPFFLLLNWWIIFPDHPSTTARIITDLILIVIGLVELAVARGSTNYSNSRVLGVLMALLTAVILTNASLYLSRIEPLAKDNIPTQMTMVILIVVIALPLQPIQALAHCLGAAVIYVACVRYAAVSFAPGVELQADYFLFLIMLTILAVILATVMYGQRRSAYFAYLQTLRAANDLRDVHSRLALSESASSMARLAAAISHELNTPIGALKSAVDTLLLLAARQATAPVEQLPRLVKLQADLRHSIQESTDRLQQIAARVARFTNLDQAERQPARVNDLLVDVAALIKPRLGPGIDIQLELSLLPEITGNPQQLSAAFYDLINNSLSALNGSGYVRVQSRENSAGVEVILEDNGRGIEGNRLRTIFEPGFQESSGRVSTGNWSMFNVRQIVREHGGEITISSEPGLGTTVKITLPTGKVT